MPSVSSSDRGRGRPVHTDHAIETPSRRLNVDSNMVIDLTVEAENASNRNINLESHSNSIPRNLPSRADLPILTQESEVEFLGEGDNTSSPSAITSGMNRLSLNTGRKRNRGRDEHEEGRMRGCNASFNRRQNRAFRATDQIDIPTDSHNLLLTRPQTARRTYTTISIDSETLYVESDESSRRGSIETISDEEPVRALGNIDTQTDLQITGSRRITKKKAAQRIVDWSKPQTSHTSYRNFTYKVGMSVELRDGAFMRIKNIYKDEPGDFMLVGPIFTRIGGGLLMPRKRISMEWGVKDDQVVDNRFPLYYKGHKLIGEVVQRVLIKHGEPKEDHGMWRRPIHDVLREVTLKILNSDDPNSLFAHAETVPSNNPGHAPWLTCRWKEVLVYDDQNKWSEHRIERISEREADVLDETLAKHLSRNPAGSMSYTFVDAFCSAGGVSTGARKAGLKIMYAFDKDDKKMCTYRANFGNLNGGAFTMGVDEFIAMVKRLGIRVDVLHLSPPCQPFSQANSTPNEQKNEMNQPPILACGELIKLLEPRIVTVEEAPGIRMRHEAWFNALINQFTEHGYALRWKSIKCADFGVPQLRQRLMIVAAAPGEVLPSFPEPTHGPGQCSIRRTLEELEDFAANNEVTHHNTGGRGASGKVPYSADGLAKTITTSGGQNYHPSGLRDFTVREYASLQTFPFQSVFGKDIDNQEFSMSELKTQIGNAVPPALSFAIYKSIIKSLRESDERARTRRRAENEDVIMLV